MFCASVNAVVRKYLAGQAVLAVGIENKSCLPRESAADSDDQVLERLLRILRVCSVRGPGYVRDYASGTRWSYPYLHKSLYECLPEEVRALMRKHRLPSYDWGTVRMSTAPTTATAEFQCFPQEAPDGTLRARWHQTQGGQSKRVVRSGAEPQVSISTPRAAEQPLMLVQHFNFRQHNQEQAVSCSTRLSRTQRDLAQCQLSGSSSCANMRRTIISEEFFEKQKYRSTANRFAPVPRSRTVWYWRREMSLHPKNTACSRKTLPSSMPTAIAIMTRAKLSWARNLSPERWDVLTRFLAGHATATTNELADDLQERGCPSTKDWQLLAVWRKNNFLCQTRESQVRSQADRFGRVPTNRRIAQHGFAYAPCLHYGVANHSRADA